MNNIPSQQSTAAILGLGLIGSIWAAHLETDGVLAASWNRTPKPGVPKFQSNLASIPEQALIIHLVVSDEHAAHDVIERIVPKLTPKHLIIQSTTIDPETSTTIKSRVEARGARYLEAPFTGSLPAAQQRKTVFYLGGSPELMEEAFPYLRRFSQNWFHLGDNKQACVFKLAMNLQLASAISVLSESLTIARKAGISDDLFFTAFKANASFSPMAALKELKLRANDFTPQFSIKHMRKDMRLLAKGAPAGQFSMLDAVRNILKKADEAGYDDLDVAAVIKLLNVP